MINCILSYCFVTRNDITGNVDDLYTIRKVGVQFMKNVIKTPAIFILFIIFLLLTACNGNTPSGYNDTPQNNNQTTQPEAEIKIPEQTEQPTPKQSPEPTEQLTTPPIDVDTGVLYMELFSPIINAYAKLEQSGYMITDTNLISDSLMEIQLDWGVSVSESLLNNKQWIPHNYGWDELPKLMYSMYSMSNLEHPELLIGVELNGAIEIISIYAIEMFDFRSYTEPDNYGAGVRNVFGVANQDIINTTLTFSLDGFGIITTTRHHNTGETYEYFQIVGTGIGVGWMDMIMTTDSRQRYSVCYIGSCDYCDDGFVIITEEEYLEVVRKFGTAGFDVGEVIEARHIDLEWTPIRNE